MDIATGYSALTAAFEIAKGLKNIDDRVKLNAAVIELQEKILSAQQAATEAKSRMQEMERRIESYEDWKKIAARYRLKDFGASTFAYELIPEHADGEPTHRICPRCFEDRKRSVLQFAFRTASHQDKYSCPSCGIEYLFGHQDTSSWNRPHRDSDWL